jgi:transposase
MYHGDMATHGASRRDFRALEHRRQHAARLFARGQQTQGAIARLLAVSRQSVMRWYHAWRAGGRARLKAAGRAGRKPRLAPRQLAAVAAALRRGPGAAGFTTNLWTLPRVAIVIERVTGVRYHPGHVWRILGRLDWTLQRPAKRAKERNDAAVQHWVDVRWPAVKKTLAAGAPGSSSRTKAASRNARRSAAPGRRAARPPS